MLVQILAYFTIVVARTESVTAKRKRPRRSNSSACDQVGEGGSHCALKKAVAVPRTGLP